MKSFQCKSSNSINFNLIIFFCSNLTADQRKMSEAIILFSVKDHDYFGMANQYVAEAFLQFKDIADITSDSGSIKQLNLTLTRPHNDGKFFLNEINKLLNFIYFLF